MTTVTGVRFREVGKIYYFDPGELELHPGDNVIVDTVRGIEFGTVMIGNRQVEDEDIVQPLKVVRRMATEDDVERVKANREKEKDAFNTCREKIKEHGLEMKLISAEYTFDNAKILFYFTADGRVDFRELVKDLAAIFKIRIELRQVGVRDETKLMGGLGGCGRPLCCASYLSDFVPVSIRMAKEQNLSLNPQKISGVCGRLMCCLKNEADTYEDLNTRLPKDGGKVVTPDGREGIAESVNVLREKVRVLFTDDQGNREMEEFDASDLQFTPRRKTKSSDKADREEQPKKKKFNSYDSEQDEKQLREIDETVDELIEEAEAENDEELKKLEIEEARAVFEDDIIAVTDVEGAFRNLAAISDAGAAYRKAASGKRKKSRQQSGDRPDKATEGTYEAPDRAVKTQFNDGPEAAPVQDDAEALEERHHRRRRRRHNRPDQYQPVSADSPENTSAPQPGTSAENTQPPQKHRRYHHHHHNSDGAGSDNTASGEQHDNTAPQHEHPDNRPENGEKKFNGAHRRFRKRRPKANTES